MIDPVRDKSLFNQFVKKENIPRNDIDDRSINKISNGVDKEIIKRNFSRYAKFYDEYATIQNLCVLRLIAKTEANGFDKILDIGCGTGNYTKLLKNRYPTAHIKAIDISREMVEIAKEKLHGRMIEFIIGDAEVMDFKEQFDFITSNASFQWFEDLETTLLKYKNLLNRNGVISFSIFGPLTFYELNQSLRGVFGEGVSISSCNFIEKVKIKKILEKYFKEVDIEQKIYKEKYTSLSELLKKIKYSGIRGNGVNPVRDTKALEGNAKVSNGVNKKGFWMPKMVNDLEEIYRKRFKHIIATYEVFFCKGMK